MSYYLINKNKDTDGYNEVHTTSCNHLPEKENQVSLGFFTNGIEAVNYAKNNGWSYADGCYYCCKEAHKR